MHRSGTMDASRIPVIVGVSRRTELFAKKAIKQPELLSRELLVDRQPSKDLARAAVEALGDAGLTPDHIGTLAAVRMAPLLGPPRKQAHINVDEMYNNLAGSVGHQLGLRETKILINTADGGNTPQLLVNELAERIARGEDLGGVAVVVGGESIALFKAAKVHRMDVPWGFDNEPACTSTRIEHVGLQKPGFAPTEVANALSAPRCAYALMEQAFRASVGAPLPAHVERCARILDRFNAVAALDPAKSWFPQRHDWKAIATPSKDNRVICTPYTKRMNAVMDVDQYGAIVLTSLAEARRLNVPADKFVFLHGCGEAMEPAWYFSSRPALGASPAMATALHNALDTAGVTAQDIAVFDLYSCFPVAVEIACEALGIDPVTDPRPLTVIGGLPYAGGPGNSYVVMSIAGMVTALRQGAYRGKFGLLNSNGWMVTKHAAGVYSTEPPAKPFARRNLAAVQTELERVAPAVVVVPRPSVGTRGRIDAYTVDCTRGAGKYVAVVIASTLDGSPHRFVASSREAAVVDGLLARDCMGETVVVVAPPPAGAADANHFVLAERSAL